MDVARSRDAGGWCERPIPMAAGRMNVHERVARPGSGAWRTLPIVLLHGFTGSGRDWEAVAEHLPERRMLAPDLPGHGNTALDGVSFREAGDAVVAAAAALGASRFHLVGYSMGGRLALYVALAHAERVASLVLESASPGLLDAAARAQRREADERLACFAEREGIVAFVDRWERTPVLAAEAQLSDAERRKLRQRRLCCRPQGLAASLRQMGTGSQPWLGERLRELHRPVALVVGEGDAKFRQIAAGMAAELPRAEIHVAGDAGHNVHLAQPARFAARIGRHQDIAETELMAARAKEISA